MNSQMWYFLSKLACSGATPELMRRELEEAEGKAMEVGCAAPEGAKTAG